jgi:hypothetical protein
MERPRWDRSRPFAAAAVAGLVAVLAVACAAEDPDTTGGQSGQAGAGQTIQIVEPADGATVNVPFEVVVDASVELGPTGQGLNHFHVWFGEAQDQPLIVESDSGTVQDAPNGEQTMWVSLQEADHTPVGDPVSITVTVQGGSDAPAPPPPGDY